MTYIRNNEYIIKPILLKNKCLQCGRYTPVYEYCEYCIQPYIDKDNKTATCNYCKEAFTCLVDGHCITCHQNLKNNRIDLIRELNEPFLNYIKRKLGFDNWKSLIQYFKTTNTYGKNRFGER